MLCRINRRYSPEPLFFIGDDLKSANWKQQGDIVIIVIGSIVVKAGSVDDALKVSQQHVSRSRSEPGCIAHGVHIDSENPQRLGSCDERE